MRKRLFTLFIVAILTVTFVPSVAAKKKLSDVDNSKNIYRLWGDFETLEQFEQALTVNDSKVKEEEKSSLTHIYGGAENSEKAIRVEMPKPDKKDGLHFAFPAVIGEKYQISFYLKYKSTDAKNIIVDFQHLDKDFAVKLPLNAEKADEWTKYSLEWVAETVDIVYNEPASVNGLRFYLDGKAASSFDFDRLCVIPYGRVEADYSKVNAHYKYKEPEEEPEEPRKGNFSDIDDHWARHIIKNLAYSDYVNGKSNTIYAPNDKVTRAEFIKMAYGTLNKETISFDDRFTDVAVDSWYADIVTSADESGIIAKELKKDGKLAPNDDITREEAATIASKTAALLGATSSDKKIFKDESEISDWSKDSVKEAASYGVISGYDDGTFKPKNTITRAEAAQILTNLIEIKGKMNIYVDADKGSDENDGSIDAPLKTVFAARDMAKELAPTMQHDIYINIRGEHYFDETLTLDETNSGMNGYDIVYTSWDAEEAIFTKAKKYTGFELHDAAKNIYKIFVGEGILSRQAFFNEVRGIRSRMVGYLKNVKVSANNRVITCDNTELLDIKYPSEVDATFRYLWSANTYRVDSFTQGENGRIYVNMHPFFFENMNTLNMYSFEKDERNSPSWLENAYEFLDEKGEWYLNRHDGYLYYIPRDGEDMSTMELKLPIGEKGLVSGEGSDYDKPVQNVTFDSILFEGTTWLKIDRAGGFVNLQNMYQGGSHDYYKTNDGEIMYSSPGATVHFERCNNITISNNRFRHTSDGYAIEFFDGSRYIDIIGNDISDISAAGILIDECVGKGRHSSRPVETWCEYINIKNNYIHHIAQDYEGSAAIGIGWPRHVEISNNELAYLPYSGMHLGWGFDQYETNGTILYDVEVSNNFIHDVMVQRVNDGSAVYFNGPSSYECDTTSDAPNNGANKNRLINNYIVNTWQCDQVYPDSGTSSWYIANNVCDTGMWRKYPTWNFVRFGSYPLNDFWCHMNPTSNKFLTFDNNYAVHDYAYAKGQMNMRDCIIDPVNLYPERDWPEEAQEIIANAGISGEYENNFDRSGPISVIATNQWQRIVQGVPIDSSLIIIDNKNNKYPLKDFDIEFWCDTPGAITMDENGYITAHQSGTYECEAIVVINGISYHQHFRFEVFGEIEKIELDKEIIHTIQGGDQNLNVYAITKDGDRVMIRGMENLEFNLKIEDESVARLYFHDFYKWEALHAVRAGKTKIVGTISFLGIEHEIDTDLRVMSHGSIEAESLPYKEFDLTKGWLNSKTGVLADGGFRAEGTKDSPAVVNGDYMLNNELIAFDLVIQDGNGWPTLAFAQKDAKGDYTTDECYMFGLCPTYIEVQRFIKGKRHYIYGQAGLNPLHGIGPSNNGNAIYTYGERMSVIMGALKHEEGTRIILTINGTNIIDYVDRDENALDPSGYIVSYGFSQNDTGCNIFYPFTNIQD